MRVAVLAPALVLATLSASAMAETSPYRGLETRTIKALSEQEVADLRAGKGMSMALAAELNGYPGPRHVLDLAAPLALSDAQIAAVQTLYDAMQAEAADLGHAIVESEEELEHRVRTSTLDEDGLRSRVMRIAELRGRLRATHLRYHLATRALLDRHQLVTYAGLRGYGDGSPLHGHRH